MKLITHYIFSTGLLTLLNVMITHSFYYSITIAGIISVLGNTIIDELGHEIKGGFIRRTPRTHTIPRSIFWGFVSALPVLFSVHFLHYYANTMLYAVVFADSFLVGPSHMFLDVFTEKGIYVKEDGKWKRFALAHYRFNDPFVNNLASFSGALMLFLAHYIL